MSVSLARFALPVCETAGHMGCMRCTIGGRPVSLARNNVVRAARVLLSGGGHAAVDVRLHADGAITLVAWRAPGEAYAGRGRSGPATRTPWTSFPDVLAHWVRMSTRSGTLVGVKTLR